MGMAWYPIVYALLLVGLGLGIAGLYAAVSSRPDRIGSDGPATFTS